MRSASSRPCWLLALASILALTACPEISTDPVFGPQGAQEMVVDVYGTNTNFTQDVTTATFTSPSGPSGIIVHQPIEVVNDGHLRLTISIPANEPTGPQTLTVATGNQAPETEFRVDPQPYIALLNPGAAEQGDLGVPITVTGVGTHFTSGSCPLNPRMLIQGVDVVSWQPPVDDLSLDIVVNIALDAPTGVHEGALEIDCDYQILYASFTIDPAIRTISVVPPAMEQGTIDTVTITANKAAFEDFFDVYFVPPGGIDIGPMTTLSATMAEVELVIHSYADPTVRTLGVIDPYGAIETVFRVSEDPTPPSVTFVPSVVRPGNVTTVDANGVNTSFSASETTVSWVPDDGLLTLSLVTTPSPTATQAQLLADVSSVAVEQQYTVTLSTGPEHATSVLWVVPEPSVTAFATEVHQDESVHVDVSGVNTHFDQTATSVVLAAGNGLSYSNWQVTGPTTASFTLHAAHDAQTGFVPSAITLETPIPAGLETVSAAATVLDGYPVADLFPPGVEQGNQGFSVQAIGRYTHWINGTTTVTVEPACQSFLTVHPALVSSVTELVFPVDVALLAPTPFSCTIEIVTDDGFIHEQVQTQLAILPGDTPVQGSLPQDINGYVDGPQLYSVHLDQGDVLRARASSNPVLYLDPTLAIYAPGGNHTSAAVAENEDEHAATDNALIVYQAPQTSTYYLVIQDRLGFEVGPFTLSLDYFEPEEESEIEPNGWPPQDTPSPMSARLLRGGFNASNSTPDVYSVGTTVAGTRIAVQVIAQSVSPYETSASNVILRLFDSSETLLDASSLGAESPDPVLYVSANDLSFIEIAADTTGLMDTTYWINLRPRVVINEVFHDEVNDWTASFVELYGEPSASLAGCNLLGVVHDGLTESVVFDISLDGSHLLESGYYVVAHDDLVPRAGPPHINADLEILNGPYVSVAVMVECGGTTLDVLCWRGDTILGCEGIAVDDATTIGNVLGRGYHIDTDNNVVDFLPQPEPSPWNRNLREVW